MIQDKLDPTVYADERAVVRHFDDQVTVEDCIWGGTPNTFEQCIGEYAKHYPNIANLIMSKAKVSFNDKMTSGKCNRFKDACMLLWNDYTFIFRYSGIKDFLLLISKHADDFKGWTFNELFVKYPYFYLEDIEDTFDYSDIKDNSLVTVSNINKVIKGCNIFIERKHSLFKKDFKLNPKKK